MKEKLQYLVNGKALEGYDPVSVYNGIAKAGNENIITQYEHAIYQFTSLENKSKFDETPDKYTPKYGGYCSIAISEGKLVRSNPHSSLIQDNELHVFYKDDSGDTQDEWKQEPIKNKVAAEIGWKKLN